MPRFSPLLMLGLAGLAALPACADAMRAMRGTSDAFDGAWVGQMNVVTRTRACTLTRGGIRVSIDGGVFDGAVRQATGAADFEGLILENGEVASATIDAQFDKDTAEVTGQFEKDDAEGRWKSQECSGTWNLRRIR